MAYSVLIKVTCVILKAIERHLVKVTNHDTSIFHYCARNILELISQIRLNLLRNVGAAVSIPYTPLSK